MIYFGLFIAELIFFFFISKKLIKSISQIVYKVTHNQYAVINFLAVLFLPGTIIHELAHLLFAGVMLVHVGDIEILPEVQEDGIKLGSVQIGRTDPFRRTIIGVAPIIAGISIILGTLYFVTPFIGDQVPWWQILIGLYLLFTISNTMFSSKKDMEGVIGFVMALVVVAILIIGGLMFFGYSPLAVIYNYLASYDFSGVEEFFKKGDMYLLAPIILDLLIIAISHPYRVNTSSC